MKRSKATQRVFTILLCTVLVFTTVSTLFAAEYPDPGKQLRMIITHGIGGSVDMPARAIAPFLSKYLGIPVVPENMEGASGRRAMEYVNNAAPDGYTIVVAAHPSRLQNQLLNPQLQKFDVLEFTMLGQWTGGDFRSTVVSTNSEYKTFMDLYNAAKEKQLKGGLTGSPPNNVPASIFIRKTLGMNVDFLPFASTAEIVTILMSNRIDMGDMPLSAALRYQEQGEVRIVAINAPERTPWIPADVPTFVELGFSGKTTPENQTAAYAPPGTPKEIQDKLAEAIKKSFDDPEFQEMLKGLQITPMYLSPEDMKRNHEADKEYITSILPLLRGDE